MHIATIKKISEILKTSGNTNKEIQACVLGYAMGLESPIDIDLHDPDEKKEWEKFFYSVPGEVNERYVINLNLALDVAELTLMYRQAVAEASKQVSEYARRYISLTGAAFGLLDQDGTVNRIRAVMNEDVRQSREQLRGRVDARRDSRRRAREERFERSERRMERR